MAVASLVRAWSWLQAVLVACMCHRVAAGAGAVTTVASSLYDRWHQNWFYYMTYDDWYEWYYADGGHGFSNCSGPPSDLVCDGDASNCDIMGVTHAYDNGRGSYINVNMSIVLTNLKSFDEKNGKLKVNADVEVWWSDCRWSLLAQAAYCSPVEAARAIGEMKGYSQAWQNQAHFIMELKSGHDADRDLLKECHERENKGDAWSPVPPVLLPASADNPSSRIDGDIFIRPAPHIEPGLWAATVKDSISTVFDVSMDFSQFPFDQHELKLRLPFPDTSVKPHLLAGIFTDNGTIAGFSAIGDRSMYDYEPSNVSPMLTAKFVKSLSALGWTTDSFKIGIYKRGSSYEVDIYLTVHRISSTIVLRFFFPLALLLVIPFAGFFLPVNHVMPRVATGFISFLTLSVFRQKGYDLVPQKTSSLLWMDAVLVVVTEIVWLAVIENVVAQFIHSRFSHTASMYVDEMAQRIFPIMCAVEVIVLTALGYWQVSQNITLIVTQGLLFLFCALFALRLRWFVKNLQRHLLEKLAREMMSKDHLWRDGIKLDRQEVDSVFRYIDSLGDQSGFISIDELWNALTAHGMKFGRGSAGRQEFRELFDAEGIQNDMGLDDFRQNFEQMLGGKKTRNHHLRMRHAASTTSEELCKS